MKRFCPPCDHQCNQGRDCPANKPVGVFTKHGNRMNAAPGIGWLIVVPVAALAVLVYAFPKQVLWALQDLWKFLTK